MTEPLGIAIVGCGYVADSYRYTLAFHGEFYPTHGHIRP